MLYTLVFTNVNCNVVFSTATKPVIRPEFSALYTSVYNIHCSLVFSTTTKLVIRPGCSALYTNVYNL